MITRRSWAIYGMLGAIWAMLVIWQIAEHTRSRHGFQNMVIDRGRSISTTCGLLMRTRGFFGVISRERLEAALNQLVDTNELRSVDLLNTNGIGWSAGTRPLSLVVPPSTPNGTDVAIRDLARVQTVITGSTSGSYHSLVNQAAVEAATVKNGFRLTHAWLGQRFNILVWQRGGTSPAIAVAPPVTRMVSPRPGTAVKGNTYFIASASSELFPVTGLDYIVRGMGQTKTVVARTAGYGWIGPLETGALPNGSYVVQSVATDDEGGVGRSKPVAFRIANETTVSRERTRDT